MVSFLGWFVFFVSAVFLLVFLSGVFLCFFVCVFCLEGLG